MAHLHQTSLCEMCYIIACLVCLSFRLLIRIIGSNSYQNTGVTVETLGNRTVTVHSTPWTLGITTNARIKNVVEQLKDLKITHKWVGSCISAKWGTLNTTYIFMINKATSSPPDLSPRATQSRKTSKEKEEPKPAKDLLLQTQLPKREVKQQQTH